MPTRRRSARIAKKKQDAEQSDTNKQQRGRGRGRGKRNQESERTRGSRRKAVTSKKKNKTTDESRSRSRDRTNQNVSKRRSSRRKRGNISATDDDSESNNDENRNTTNNNNKGRGRGRGRGRTRGRGRGRGKIHRAQRISITSDITDNDSAVNNLRRAGRRRGREISNINNPINDSTDLGESEDSELEALLNEVKDLDQSAIIKQQMTKESTLDDTQLHERIDQLLQDDSNNDTDDI